VSDDDFIQIFHAGEIEAQVRFNPSWNLRKSALLARIVRGGIDDLSALFIEGCPFFFLATADAEGHCDCSYRGREEGSDGRLFPVARVLDPHTLVFPEFSGNGMFSSLGNLLVNPQAGLLFIDFPSQSRLRVNGCAEVMTEPDDVVRALWPTALRAVRVRVEQVYWNCSRRIPKRIV
jgi:predicted pyridoxine 5'-phosphate oxidase superfamily flavin-nucleotide-binding protein